MLLPLLCQQVLLLTGSAMSTCPVRGSATLPCSSPSRNWLFTAAWICRHQHDA
jgi:hypothetical protein